MGTTSSSTSSDSGTFSYNSSGDTDPGTFSYNSSGDTDPITFQYGVNDQGQQYYSKTIDQGTQCCPCTSTPYLDANNPYVNGGVPATYTGSVEHFKVDSRKEKFHLFVLIMLLILFGLFLYHSK